MKDLEIEKTKEFYKPIEFETNDGKIIAEKYLAKSIEEITGYIITFIISYGATKLLDKVIEKAGNLLDYFNDKIHNAEPFRIKISVEEEDYFIFYYEYLGNKERFEYVLKRKIEGVDNDDFLKETIKWNLEYRKKFKL